MTKKKGFALTEAQQEALQSEDSYLRGTAALAIVNEAVKASGVVIPNDYVFKQRDANIVATANHAVFELKGGVPAYLLWAIENPTDFYKIYAKLAPAETNIKGAGNVMVMTNVPSSALDDVTLNKAGFVSTVIVEPADEDSDE